MSNTPHARTYPLLGRFRDPTPPPQHIADAVAAGVELDADWLEEIGCIQAQEDTDARAR